MRCLIVALAFCMTSPLYADVESGLPAGTDLPVLSVHAVTGDMPGEVENIVTSRGEKPTIYFFVPAEKWSRPTARLLRKLDTDLKQHVPEGQIVAVWLTEDIAASKEYLPRAQGSLKLDETTFTVYNGDQYGPGEWGINTDADCTIVLATGGKALESHGYVSPNETLAEGILAALAKK